MKTRAFALPSVVALGAPPAAALLLLVAASAAAGEFRFEDSAVVTDAARGEKVTTTRAVNDSVEGQSVTVTAGGVVYQAGRLEAGESARVHVVERRGAPPVILFSKEGEP